MMHMKRQISTATSDFRQLIEAGYLYVDKTRYVHQMVKESLQNYFFISRPRRYGKSLFCSTLEHLFKGERGLFKGLYIAEETDYSFEKYPVLHFNFSLLDTTTYENFLLGFKNMIRNLARENGVDVKDSTPTYMLQEFLDKSEKQSVIIIDEFDSPIIDSLDDREKLENIRKAFSNFYNTIKNKKHDKEQEFEDKVPFHCRGDEAFEHVHLLEDEQPHRRIYAGRVRFCLRIHG